jgi:pimeloyl-ACP methyl ester carboxylesterase
VPGWSDTPRILDRCRQFLVDQGWPATHIECVGFADRYGSNITHAAECRQAIGELCRRSGSNRADVVAHSMGGLAIRWMLRTDPTLVRTVIFAGTPHAGTWAAWLAWGEGGREMRPGSEFIRKLATSPLPSSVRAHCLRTPIDTRILPGSSAWLDSAECHTVRTPTHQRMLRHRPTLELISRILRQP